MHSGRIVLTAILCFLFGHLFGQQNIIVISNRVKDRTAYNKDIDKNKFLVYPYTSNTINLTPFKSKHREIDLPNSVTITAPDLSSFKDSVIMVGFVNEDLADAENLIIMVVGNYYSNKRTFFVDRNLDKNYLNDGVPYVIRGGESPRQIEIFPRSDFIDGFDIWISFPKVDYKSVFKSLRQVEKIENQLSLGFFGGIGTGKLSYRYDNLDTGFPVWYDVNTSIKQLGAKLSYNFRYFRIGVSVALQNLFYYTSYHNKRFDNPSTIFVPSKGDYITIENVTTVRSQDRHPKNRFLWSVDGALRIPLSRTIDLQPMAKVGYINYSPNRYVIKRAAGDSVYKQDRDFFIEYGMQLEAAVGYYRSFFLGLVNNRTAWDPVGFFEAQQPYENLETHFNTWHLRVGYKFVIFR